MRFSQYSSRIVLVAFDKGSAEATANTVIEQNLRNGYKLPEMLIYTPTSRHSLESLKAFQPTHIFPVTPAHLSNKEALVVNDLAQYLSIELTCPVWQISTIIADLDDTLLKDSGKVYADNEKEILYQLVTWGFDQRESRAVRKDKFALLRKQLGGISTDLQYQTNLETYRTLCEKHGLQPQAEHEACLIELTAKIYTARVYPFPGTKSVLAYLIRKGLNLILATRGDEQSQLEKVYLNGLERFFTKIYIWPEKTRTQFQQVMYEHGLRPESICVVGDGMGADINPALEAGMNAIHVKTGQFREDEAEPIGFHGIAQNINKVPHALMMLREQQGQSIRKAA